MKLIEVSLNDHFNKTNIKGFKFISNMDDEYDFIKQNWLEPITIRYSDKIPSVNLWIKFGFNKHEDCIVSIRSFTIFIIVRLEFISKISSI